MNLRKTSVGKAKLIGGSLCLDFTNTVGGRNGSAVLMEKLKAYNDLLSWSVHAGTVEKKEAIRLEEFSSKHPEEAAGVLTRAIRLRETIYRICQSVMQQGMPKAKDMELLNHELQKARSHEEIELTKAGFQVRRKSTLKDLDRILWPVAISIGDLLTEGDLKKLRRCDGEECGWLFVDTSKNHSRQWCDMSDCGNIAKVRRFRSRRP